MTSKELELILKEFNKDKQFRNMEVRIHQKGFGPAEVSQVVTEFVRTESGHEIMCLVVRS